MEIVIRGHGWMILLADPGLEHRDHEGAHGVTCPKLRTGEARSWRSQDHERQQRKRLPVSRASDEQFDKEPG